MSPPMIPLMSFDVLRMSGILTPFVVSLSNHANGVKVKGVSGIRSHEPHA